MLPFECFVSGESEAVLPECLVDVFDDDIVIGVDRPEDVVGFEGTLSYVEHCILDEGSSMTVAS